MSTILIFQSYHINIRSIALKEKEKEKNRMKERKKMCISWFFQIIVEINETLNYWINEMPCFFEISKSMKFLNLSKFNKWSTVSLWCVCVHPLLDNILILPLYSFTMKMFALYVTKKSSFSIPIIYRSTLITSLYIMPNRILITLLHYSIHLTIIYYIL